MAKSTTYIPLVTYAGIDYHKKFSVVTLGDQNGKVIGSTRIANDRMLLQDFFSQYPDITCLSFEFV